jgi:hypothetical protein
MKKLVRLILIIWPIYGFEELKKIDSQYQTLKIYHSSTRQLNLRQKELAVFFLMYLIMKNI